MGKGMLAPRGDGCVESLQLTSPGEHQNATALPRFPGMPLLSDAPFAPTLGRDCQTNNFLQVFCFPKPCVISDSNKTASI